MATRRTQFGRDTGLQARMLLTMFLLGLLYVVFVGVLFAAGAGAGIIVTVAVVLLLVQLFASDKLAMATLGVKEVSPAEEPEPYALPFSLSQTREKVEVQRIVQALHKHNNNRLRAAAELGISRMTLYKKLHKYGLTVPSPPAVS